MIRVTFADSASRDAFADKFKLTSKLGDTALDMDWHYLQFAKADSKVVDFEQAAVLAGTGPAVEHEFIVKGNPATFAPHITATVADLGNGFYHVKSSDLNLADHVDSIEITSLPMKLLGTMAGMTSTASTLDPTSADAQWPRIRVASRYRPLLDAYSTHEMVYNSVPELFIVDTGVNFSHPEFDYTGFQHEDFFSIYPGDFADDVGHGTAVASMACGKNLGIANHVKVMNVKVGNASGTGSLLQIGQAIDAILARAAADPMKTRIVNMSWGTTRSSWLDAKVQGLLDAGVTVVCAAGNDGIDVELISPAGMNDVITVGSIDKYDIPSGFNNISPSDAGVTTGSGLSLDLFAPGEQVMLAKAAGGYWIDSGTSFAAPLVAGIAAEIGALSNSFVPYVQMKNSVISTATENALLFEDDRFSENQNRLAYIFTSDPNANYKSNDMMMYLGVHPDSGEMIVANMNSSIDTAEHKKVFPDDVITWSLVYDDPAIEAEYGEFLHIGETDGMVSITKPTVELPPETRLKMVSFKAKADTGRGVLVSPTVFFFHLNPAYSETKDSDITLALTETNSISFYGSWTNFIK